MRTLEAESQSQARQVGRQRLGQLEERHDGGRDGLLGRACGIFAGRHSQALRVRCQSCWPRSLGARSRCHVHWHYHVQHGLHVQDSRHGRRGGHRLVHAG